MFSIRIEGLDGIVTQIFVKLSSGVIMMLCIVVVSSKSAELIETPTTKVVLVCLAV